MTPFGSSADQGRAAGIGVGLVGLQKKGLWDKGYCRSEEDVGRGATAPGMLSRQRLEHRVHDIILQ